MTAPPRKARPIVQAFLLAERYYVDKSTGQRIIVGTFNHFKVPVFPAVTEGGFIYLNITGLHGPNSFEFQFRNLKAQQILMRTEMTIDLGNQPHTTIEHGFQIPGFVLPEPGCYAMDLVWKNVPIATMRIEARKIEATS